MIIAAVFDTPTELFASIGQALIVAAGMAVMSVAIARCDRPPRWQVRDADGHLETCDSRQVAELIAAAWREDGRKVTIIPRG